MKNMVNEVAMLLYTWLPVTSPLPLPLTPLPLLLLLSSLSLFVLHEHITISSS